MLYCSFYLIPLICDIESGDRWVESKAGCYTRCFSVLSNTGHEIKREPIFNFISFIKVSWIFNSKSLGSLQKFEGPTGEFKGALGLASANLVPVNSLSSLFVFTWILHCYHIELNVV